MATSNTVTLTFAANTRPLQQGFKDVETGAARTEAQLVAAGHSTQTLGDTLEETGRKAKYSKEALRGLGDASILMGGQMGQSAVQAALLLGSIKDLGKGLGGLAGGFTVGKLALGGFIAAIATAGVAVAAHVDHTGMLNEINRTAADSAYYLSKGIQFVGQGIPGVGGLLSSLVGKTDAWSKSAHGATDAADGLANALMRLDNQKRIAGTYGIADQNPGGDAFVDQSALDMMELDPVKLAASYSTKSSSGGGGGSTLSAAMKADQQKAQATLSAWQSTLDKFRGISQGIQDALSPKLEAGDKGLMLFPGLSLLDKLKKQLADTLHLQRDIAALGKAGLNGDLLGSLVQGGLSSLPAADELLAGGKGEISAVNKTASGITKAGGTLAGNEAMRQLNAQKDVKVKIDVTGGENDLKKLIRKWVRVDGGGSVQLALGGK